MREYIITKNGHQYKYLNAWDKKSKTVYNIYLGRYTKDNKFIPSKTAGLDSMISSVDALERIGKGRGKAWEIVMEQAKAVQENKKQAEEHRKEIDRKSAIASIVTLCIIAGMVLFIIWDYSFTVDLWLMESLIVIIIGLYVYFKIIPKIEKTRRKVVKWFTG